MHLAMKTPDRFSLLASILVLLNLNVSGQVECAAPGSLRGIRVDGELMAFNTGIRAVAPTTAEVGQAGRGGEADSFRAMGTP